MAMQSIGTVIKEQNDLFDSIFNDFDFEQQLSGMRETSANIEENLELVWLFFPDKLCQRSGYREFAPRRPGSEIVEDQIKLVNMISGNLYEILGGLFLYSFLF